MLSSGDSTHALPDNLHEPYQNQNAFPFLDSLCRVCKSLSTGVHYGVSTCEGCKGFFKRSIPKCQHYKCYFGGDCEITKETRNRCKSCRFQRCLQVGMALEAVKMGRIPKGERERAMKITEASAGRLRIKSLKPIAPAPSGYPTTPLLLSPTQSPKSNTRPGAPNANHQQQQLSRCSSSTSIYEGKTPSPHSGIPFFQAQQPSFSSQSYSPDTTITTKQIKVEDLGEPSFRDPTGLDSPLVGGTVNFSLQDHLLSPDLSPVSETADDGGDGFGQAFNPAFRQNRQNVTVSSREGMMTGQFSHRSHRAGPLVMNGNFDEPYRSNPGLLVRSQSVIPSLTPAYTGCGGSNEAQNVRMNFGSHHDARAFSRRSSLQVDLGYHRNNHEYHSSHFPALSARATSRDSLSASSVYSDTSATPSNRDSHFGSSRSANSIVGYSGDSECTDYPTRSVSESFFSRSQESVDHTGKSWLESCSPVKTEPRDTDQTFTSPVARVDGLSSQLGGFPARLNDTRAQYPPQPTAKEIERTNMLERIIQIIDDAGNDAYRSETTEAVEFMLRMWQEGRLIPDSPRSSDVTVEKVRCLMKDNFARTRARILKFSEKIPGLSRLHESDVRALVTHCEFEVWMIQNAAFLVNNESYIMLPHNDEPLHYSRYWMSVFLPENTIDAFMTFADDMNSHQFSFLELSLLKAIIIVCPEREGLEDPTSVAKLRRVLQEALFQAFKRRQSPSPAEMYRKIGFLMCHLTRVHESYSKNPIDIEGNRDLRLDEEFSY